MSRPLIALLLFSLIASNVCRQVYNQLQEDADRNGRGDACCCGRYTDGMTGNANGDLVGKINLPDITRLIDFVYISHAETAACQ